MTFPHQRFSGRRLGVEFALAAVLAGAVWVSRRWFSFQPSGEELLWLPSGLAVGVVLCCGLRHLPGLLLGVLAGGACCQWSWGGGAMVREGAEVLVEAAVALGVTRSLRFDRSLAGLREVGVFLGGAVVLPPLLVVLAGAALERGLGSGPGPGLLEIGLRAGSHMAGIGLVAPVLILSNRDGWRRLTPLRRVLRVLLQVCGPLLLVYGDAPAPADGVSLALLLPLPLAAVLVVSFGLGAAVQAVLLMELVLVGLTARGLGFFAAPDALSAQFGVSSYMTLLSAMTLVVGGIKRQRQRAEQLALAAMQGARVAQWVWVADRGLTVHDREWAACFGVAPGEPASVDRIDAATHPDDRFSLRVWCADEESEPNREVEEFRLKAPDGRWRWVTSRRLPDVPGFAPAPGVMYGVFQDVTEHKEMEALRLEAARQEAELRNLKLTIQPHFLFNSLNSLRSLIASRPAEAREFVTRLSTFLHAGIAEAEEDLLPLERSLSVARTYLEIERVRFGDRLAVEIEATPEARAAAFPPLLLQTLVENALKYGLAKRPEGGRIRIEATVANGQLRVAVTNDGRIVQPPAESLGTGLRSAERRVKLIFGPAATVSLREEAGAQVVAEVLVPVVPPGAALNQSKD